MKNTLYTLVALLAIGLLAACEQPKEEGGNTTPPNPAADGFHAEESDAQAIEIADKVMNAMGGRPAWDAVQTLQWNFGGRRQHYWNKHTHDIRIESPKDSLVLLHNLHSKVGKVFIKGVEVTDSVAKYMELAHAWWINDSYWLVMPYKLKDTGVTLKYLREGKTLEGDDAHVLQLTFNNVGVTPNNRYEVYVEKSSNLVRQWDFFGHFEDTEPGFTTGWDNWTQHGGIMLSGERTGIPLGMLDIKVDDPNLDPALFTTL